jgi:hypothetical protein
LRHQLHVLQRSRPRRLQLAQVDRWLWVVLSRVLTGWRTGLVIVEPETVIAWHRRGFRLWWAWRSRRRMGRPTVPTDIRTLIREMSNANPRWGAPRIHGELLRRNRRLSSRCREIPGSWAPAAVANLAHRASDGVVDGPATPRGLSVGRNASISAPRSRSRVRQPAAFGWPLRRRTCVGRFSRRSLRRSNRSRQKPRTWASIRSSSSGPLLIRTPTCPHCAAWFRSR